MLAAMLEMTSRLLATCSSSLSSEKSEKKSFFLHDEYNQCANLTKFTHLTWYDEVFCSSER